MPFEEALQEFADSLRSQGYDVDTREMTARYACNSGVVSVEYYSICVYPGDGWEFYLNPLRD